MAVDIPEMKKQILLRFLGAVIVLGLMFFLPAGTFDYWEAWLYSGIVLIPMFFAVFYFLKHDPELLVRRMEMKEKEKEQDTIIKISIILFFIGLLIPGFDYRFGWSNVPFVLVIFSNAVVFLGYITAILTLKENSYAARIVQVEKEQKVISTGPYSIVRHPMYFGTLLMFVFTPLALGSYLALIFFVPFIPLLVFRILNEEKILKKGLSGYADYCQKVKYRLVPLIW
ncbi:isoprenylcysteine carboxylmethyltransferase family protein [Candidatus Micrarchaeota archaeon]|nr:isoprenylcysteine carboxylmethyltransferase family protein [Candidatus Micrarchaeota archaeon]